MNFSNLGYIRVAAANPPVTIAAPQNNAQTILASAEALANDAVALGVYPELCLSGYSAEDLFFNEALLSNCRHALKLLVDQCPLPLMIVGVPWRLRDGRLLNCAAAIAPGKLLGLVPKSNHPNHGEFYELRWFSSGALVNETISDKELGEVPIRVDQLFLLGEHAVGIELCEDMWAPVSPATQASLAGATIIANLSASNELIAKADYRRDLIRMSAAKNLCAYVYASANTTESTKDVVFGGHNIIVENGHMLAESDRFQFDPHAILADIDTALLLHDRSQNATFTNTPRPHGYRITTASEALPQLSKLNRQYPAHPFVPDDAAEFSARAQEILAIQATGLARRMLSANINTLVIGLSGGLDSTLAFLVALDALDKLSLTHQNLHAITMPGPGTTTRTLTNANELARAAGTHSQTIAIDSAVTQHLADLDHDGDHDVVFENAQARERTQILFNYANKSGGLVVGTGDLSELALGWCTFNADHMANYNVNASVPKTLVSYLVGWYAEHRASPALRAVLMDVMDTPISPELLPPVEDDISQKTEHIVGPYELHDFFLYHFLRTGASPTKIFYLACTSFHDSYPPSDIQHWLRVFLKRFFSQQFKRTTLPPGPKVGTVSLSPRGDWRMPDEAVADQYIAELDRLDLQDLSKQ